MTQGYILKISVGRRNLFEESQKNIGRFAEPVPRFSHPRGSPLIVFISTKENVITHLATGRGGIHAGTGLRRLNLLDIHPLEKDFSFEKIIKNITPRIRRYIQVLLKNGGILPPQSFSALIEAFYKIDPNVDSLLGRFSTKRYSTISDLKEKIIKSLASQKEALNTALQLADIDRKPLLEWSPRTTEQTSFLDGLPQSYTREDVMIINDMHNFPGLNLIKSTATGYVSFENQNTRLDIILANRLPLEEQTGTDLIYYNATYQSFVMVQYKAMEHSQTTIEPEYRLPNKQLSIEIARMNEVLVQIKTESLPQNRHEYRLNNNPFFIKLCPRIVLRPDSVDLTPGMYFTIDHWKLLEQDLDLIGSRGGRKVTYGNVGRKINNTEFADLVQNAWIGTTPTQSILLENLIKSVLESGKAVTFAIKSNKNLSDLDEKEAEF